MRRLLWQLRGWKSHSSDCVSTARHFCDLGAGPSRPLRPPRSATLRRRAPEPASSSVLPSSPLAAEGACTGVGILAPPLRPERLATPTETLQHPLTVEIPLPPPTASQHVPAQATWDQAPRTEVPTSPIPSEIPPPPPQPTESATQSAGLATPVAGIESLPLQRSRDANRKHMAPVGTQESIPIPPPPPAQNVCQSPHMGVQAGVPLASSESPQSREDAHATPGDSHLGIPAPPPQTSIAFVPQKPQDISPQPTSQKNDDVAHAPFAAAKAGDATIPPPTSAPPPPGADPTFPRTFPTMSADNSNTSAGGSTQTSGGPLTAAQQYEKLKHFLPMMKEPETARPAPDSLQVGTQLRVEWSGAWWAARVKEEQERRVKIAFDTWSSQHDEWIPRDSSRLRLRAPDDVEPDSSEQPQHPKHIQDILAKLPELPDRVDMRPRVKPFVPKPYNPEKEFLKRQLRLKDKIAQMQRSRLGGEDPALQVSHIRSVQNAALALAQSKANPSHSPASSIPLPPPTQEPPPLRISAVESAPSTAVQAPTRVNESVAAVADAAGDPAEPAYARTEGSSSSVATTPTASTTTAPGIFGRDAPEPVTSAPAVNAPLTSLTPAQEAAKPLGSSGSLPPGPIRWEECLTDKKERYYWEVATGHVQWELPSEGWVELLADDGSRYFWEPRSDTTQWTRPQQL